MKRKPIFRAAILAIVVSLCFMLPKANAQNMDKGLHLLELDQFHKAAVIFKESIKQTPAPQDAWYYLGECYLRLDRADSATICFNTGIQSDPKNPSFLAGLGMVSFLKNNPADAKLNFVNASKLSLKKYPNGILSILQGYAYCKFPVDDFITGIYKKAQEAKTQNAQVHLAWGEINTNAGNTSEAASAYQRALAADEKNISAHYRLGQMYNSARNYPAAIAEIEAALQMDANYYPAIREKADALFKRELKYALSDPNLCLLIYSGILLEREGRAGNLPNLSKSSYEKDLSFIIADEVLGTSIATYISGSKGAFEFVRFDKRKPGILAKLGPFMDDVIGGLIGGVSSNMYSRGMAEFQGND